MEFKLYSRVVTLCTAIVKFNKCKLCPHCIYVFYLSEKKQRLLPLTA